MNATAVSPRGGEARVFAGSKSICLAPDEPVLGGTADRRLAPFQESRTESRHAHLDFPSLEDIFATEASRSVVSREGPRALQPLVGAQEPAAPCRSDFSR